MYLGSIVCTELRQQQHKDWSTFYKWRWNKQFTTSCVWPLLSKHSRL